MAQTKNSKDEGGGKIEVKEDKRLERRRQN